MSGKRGLFVDEECRDPKDATHDQEGHHSQHQTSARHFGWGLNGPRDFLYLIQYEESGDGLGEKRGI